MRPRLVVASCLLVVASASPAVGAVVESVPPSAVSLKELERTELRGADPRILRVLTLADRFARDGVRYRRLKVARRLAPASLASPLRRLSCSEFLWSVFSLAGLDMGQHPISSKRLGAMENPYPHALGRVTDGTVRPGDVLVYGARHAGASGQVGHVVMVVSAEQRIVVGSHGRDSTPAGAPLGAGYRRLPGGWSEWSGDRVLLATYRLLPARPVTR